MAGLAPRITEITTSLLDAVDGADRFDLVDALAYPPLARLEAKIALDILLERYREIAVDVAGPIEFHNPWQVISVKRLPVLVA